MDSTGTFFLPPSGSTFAPEVDSLLAFITYVSLFFMALVFVSIAVFLVKYRKRAGVPQPEKPPTHNLTLEVLWTGIPLLLVLVMFAWGFRLYLKQSIVPKGALEIKVTGQKWLWTFEYPNGATSAKNLIVPADQPVKLLMSSRDVIHSFYVPAFRIKRDVLPNRYTVIWFKAPRPGVFDLFCAEYCGLQHSGMIGSVRVVPTEEYTQWLDENKALDSGASLADQGRKISEMKACIGCHTTDGSPLVGPSFLNIYGHEVSFNDGTKLVVDENYLRESILDPSAKIVAGYPPTMPTYQGQVTDPELDALIAFIKSLSE